MSSDPKNYFFVLFCLYFDFHQINQITGIALNVNCSTTKVKTYLIWLSETWLFFPHSHSLHFEGIHETNHEHWRTKIPHTRSQVYPLSNLLFLSQNGSTSLCSGPQKVNQVTVLLDKLVSKQKVLDHIIYLLNILATEKYQIKIPQCNINHILTNLRKGAEYPSEIQHFYQPLVLHPLSAILNFIQAKRDVTLTVMIQPMFCLETPLPPSPSSWFFQLASLLCLLIKSILRSLTAVSQIASFRPHWAFFAFLDLLGPTCRGFSRPHCLIWLLGLRSRMTAEVQSCHKSCHPLSHHLSCITFSPKASQRIGVLMRLRNLNP